MSRGRPRRGGKKGHARKKARAENRHGRGTVCETPPSPAAEPPSDSEQELCIPAGLENLGNTCFFNSVLQCLARLPSLQSYFQSTKSNAIVRFEGAVTLALRLFLMTLWRHERQRAQKRIFADSSTGTESDIAAGSSAPNHTNDSAALERATRRLFEEIGEKCPRFKGWAQQDAHELLLALLWTIDDEEQERLRAGKSMPKTPDSAKTVEQARSFVRDIFECRVEDRLEMPSSGGKPQVRHEECLALSLPILRLRQSGDARVRGGRNEEQRAGTRDMCASGCSVDGKDAPKAGADARRQNLDGTDLSETEWNQSRSLMQANNRSYSEDEDYDESDCRLACVSSLFDDVELDDEPACRDSASRACSATRASSTGIGVHGGLLALTCEPMHSKNSVHGSSQMSEVCTRLGECIAEWARTEVIELVQSTQASKECPTTGHDAEKNSSEKLASNKEQSTSCTSSALPDLNTANGVRCESAPPGSQTGAGAVSTSNGFHSGDSAAAGHASETVSDWEAAPLKARKWMRLENAPRCLVLHMKRFTQLDVGYVTKIDDHISFPETLSLGELSETEALAPMVAADLARVRYELCGVVEHNGTLHFGHYVAYVRARRVATSNQQWFYCSDRHIRSCTLDEVLQAQAYLLFYFRVSESEENNLPAAVPEKP